MSWVIVPREQLEILDDWDVAAMSATGSVTIVAKGAVVPGSWADAVPEDDVGDGPRRDVPRGGGHAPPVLRVDVCDRRRSTWARSTPRWRSAGNGIETARRVSTVRRARSGRMPGALGECLPDGADHAHGARRMRPRRRSRSPAEGTPQTLEEEASGGCTADAPSNRAGDAARTSSTATDPVATSRTTTCAGCRPTSRWCPPTQCTASTT